MTPDEVVTYNLRSKEWVHSDNDWVHFERKKRKLGKRGYCSLIGADCVQAEMDWSTNQKWVLWTDKSQPFSSYQKDCGDGEPEMNLTYELHTTKFPS